MLMWSSDPSANVKQLSSNESVGASDSPGFIWMTAVDFGRDRDSSKSDAAVCRSAMSP